MPTHLTKPIVRRVGKLVVELRSEGLLLRSPRQHESTARLVSWEQLERVAIKVWATRAEAFRRPAPEGWIPAPKEWVWIDAAVCRSPSIGQVQRILPTLDGEAMLMVYLFADALGQVTATIPCGVSSLRPAPLPGGGQAPLPAPSQPDEGSPP